MRILILSSNLLQRTKLKERCGKPPVPSPSCAVLCPPANVLVSSAKCANIPNTKCQESPLSPFKPQLPTANSGARQFATEAKPPPSSDVAAKRSHTSAENLLRESHQMTEIITTLVKEKEG